MRFTPQFLALSETATRCGIDNTPPVAVLPALLVAGLGMVEVEKILGHPVTVNSGYRCLELNALVRGEADSAHVHGYAVDFVCPAAGTPLDIVKTIKDSLLVFDQLIQEGHWVHISFAPVARRQVLTAHFVDGKANYTAGV